MICPLCNSHEIKYIFTTNEFHGKYSPSPDKFKYYQCLNCQSLFPNIDNINLKEFYKTNYRHLPKLIEKIIIKLNFFFQNTLLKILFKNKSISILDVGCGNGDYLNQLSKKYKKTGIDIKIDNKKSKLIQADFLKYKFSKKFDVINFSHSLEHLINPQLAITRAHSLLNKNGVVIISLPVVDSYSFIINPKKAFHLDPPRHIFIPDTTKFKQILQNKFFNVKIFSIPFEFPLDLFWTLINSQYKFIIPIFSILKLLKPETKLFVCRR